MLADAALGAALGAALVVTGIGLTMGKSWSRSIGIPVAALQIFSTLGAVVLVIVTMAREPETNGPDSMTLITLNIASIVIKLLTAVFPAVVLLILMKRSTREALEAPAA
jgi:mannose/fructose/N-acetylgalactosamine-specific phosphotransferase system component IIC